MTLVCAVLEPEVVLDQPDSRTPIPSDPPPVAKAYRIPTRALLGLVAALEIAGHLTFPAIAMIGPHPLGAITLDTSNFILWSCKSRVSTIALLLVATGHVSISTPFYYMLGGRALEPKATKQPKRLIRFRGWLRIRIDNLSHRFKVDVLLEWTKYVRGKLIESSDSRLIALLCVFLWPCRETAMMAGTLRLSRLWFGLFNITSKVTKLLVLIYFGLIAAQLVAYAVYPLAAVIIGFNSLLKRMRLDRTHSSNKAFGF